MEKNLKKNIYVYNRITWLKFGNPMLKHWKSSILQLKKSRAFQCMTIGWQGTEGQGHFSVTPNGSRSTLCSFFLESSLVKSGHSDILPVCQSLEFISVPRSWPVLSWGSDACCCASSIPVTYFLGATCSRVCLLGLRHLASAPCSKKTLRFLKIISSIQCNYLIFELCVCVKSIWLYCIIF